jgi:hypothetical protein
MFSGADVLAAKVEFALKTAVMLCDPVPREAVLKVAIAPAASDVVPSKIPKSDLTAR